MKYFYLQGLGVPFNIASYALLAYMIAHVTDLKVSFWIIFYRGDMLWESHVHLEVYEEIGKCFPMNQSGVLDASQLVQQSPPHPNLQFEELSLVHTVARVINFLLLYPTLKFLVEV